MKWKVTKKQEMEWTRIVEAETANEAESLFESKTNSYAAPGDDELCDESENTDVELATDEDLETYAHYGIVKADTQEVQQ